MVEDAATGEHLLTLEETVETLEQENAALEQENSALEQEKAALELKLKAEVVAREDAERRAAELEARLEELLGERRP